MITSPNARQTPENPAVSPPHDAIAPECLQMPVIEIAGLDWLGDNPRTAPVRRGRPQGGAVAVIFIEKAE